MTEKTKILGISGSLRTKSYNTQTLHEIAKLVPENIDFQIYDIGTLPLFNDDSVPNPPESVVKFKEAVRSSDAIIFASPEYNYSISGVLKNAIDWGSRPPAQNAFDGKPGAIVGVSNGKISTGRSQFDLRKICVALNMEILVRPEVLIGPAADFFDQDNNLTNQDTKARLQQLIDNLLAKIK